MGASQSHVISDGTPASEADVDILDCDIGVLFPESSELKLRDGNKTDPIPSPRASEQSLYSQILHSDDFKSHLFKNLDDDYLLSSLLTSDAADHTTLLEGIERLRRLEGETKDAIERDVKNFESTITAGVNLDLSETLEYCVKGLDFQGDIDVSPFLLSFQRRLALLMRLKPFLLREQKKAHEQYTSRVYSSVSQELSVSKFPELDILHSLKNAGVSVLDIFAKCYPLIKAQGSAAAQDALIQPVADICDDLISLQDLRLYNCWVPAPEPPKVSIGLNSSSITCSNGQGSAAVDGKATTAWTTNKLRASWTVMFDEPAFLSSIKLAFVPGVSNMAGLGAPRRVIISVIYENDEGESIEKASESDHSEAVAEISDSDANVHSAEAAGDTPADPPLGEASESEVIKQETLTKSRHKYTAVRLVMPDVEFAKQGSWKQTYELDDPSVGGKAELATRKVVGMKLVFSRRASANLTDNIKLYSFSALAKSQETRRFNVMDDMQALTHSLFPVLGTDNKVLARKSIAAILSLVRSSGSLKILLLFVNFMFGLDSQSEQEVADLFANEVHEATTQLFSAIHHESNWIQERLNSGGFNTLNDVVFSSENRSTEGLEITEDGLRLSCWSGSSTSGTSGSRVFGFLSNTMEDGIWVWDISILSDLAHGGGRTPSASAFGVGCATKSSSGVANYEERSHVYVVQANTGKIFHGGVAEASGEVRVPIMKQNDVCRFCYDSNASTVSLSINGKYIGIILEGVPSGCSPLVVLSGERKTVRLLRVLHKSQPPTKKTVIHSSPSSQSNSPKSVLSSDTSFSNMLRPESPDDVLNHSDDILKSSFLTSLTSLLSRVSQIGKLRMREASRSFEVQLEGDDFHPSSLLEYPYCVDVSINTISLLIDLLEKCQCLNCSVEEKKENTLSVLSLLDCQFFCLTKSKCDPLVLGFPKKGSDANCIQGDENENSNVSSASSSAGQIQRAANALINFSENSDSDIQIAAARVYARGSAIFLPSVLDKIGLVLKLIDAQDSKNEEAKYLGSDKSSGSTYVILEIIVNRLSGMNDIQQIIDTIKTGMNSDTLHNELYKFLQYLLNTAAEHSKLSLEPSSSSDTSENASGANDVAASKKSAANVRESFTESICDLLSRFQEALVMEVLGSINHGEGARCGGRKHKSTVKVVAIRRFFVSYFKLLRKSSLIVLQAATVHREKSICSQLFGAVPAIEYHVTSSGIDSAVRNSIVGTLLQPFIHAVCFMSKNLELSETLLPVCLHLLEDLSTLCRNSPFCKRAQEELSKFIQRRSPVEVLNMRKSQDGDDGGNSGGWKIINVGFEPNPQVFESNHDSTLYTSTTGSNTCALIDISFSGQDRGAWELELMNDTLNDECSLFGVARKPLTSRCYSSSSDLWMRRSYNGYLYAQGRTGNRSLGRIHKGDIIRVEFDAREGSLSYSVNGGAMSVGFTDIADEVWPAVGSYRSGVVVKLLKVEIFKAADSEKDVMRDPNKLDWVLPDALSNKREPNILCYPHAKDKDAPIPPWITSRADFGASSGIHTWSFEILERSRSFYALGITTGGENQDIPVVSKLGRKNSDLASLDLMQMAWYSDGSLWANGQLCAEGCGASVLPLGRLCSVTMRLDFDEGTLSFYVDGSYVGTAFGPVGSNAACTKFSLHSFQKPPSWNTTHAVYPASTISSTTHQIRIKPTGFYGSVVIPLELMIQKATATVFGRLAASVLKGVEVDAEEFELMPWLQTPMFIGGLEAESNAVQSRSNKARNDTSSSKMKDWGAMWRDQKEVQNTSDSYASDVPIVDSLGPPVDPSEDEIERIAVDEFLSKFTQSEVEPVLQHFIDWLERISPEPAFLVKAFKANGSYSFPRAEMPFIATIIKHGGLQKEALSVFKIIEKSIHEGNTIALENLPIPTEDMSSMWKRLQQLRLFLRKQRQLFKASANASSDRSAVESVDKPEAVGSASLTEERSVTASSPRSSDVMLQLCGEDAQIAWKEQESEICSEFLDPDTENSISCDVVETGVDHEEACIYVKFRTTPTYGDSVDDEFEIDYPQSSALVHCRSDVPVNIEYVLTTNNQSACVAGVIRYNLEVSDFESIISLGVVNFRYMTGFSECSLVLNTDPIDATDFWAQGFDDDIESSADAKEQKERKGKTATFEELLDRVEERSRFLFSLSPAAGTVDDPDINTRGSLVGLLDKYAPSSSGYSQPKLRRLRSQDGQERWRRVIDFLRVSSTVSKRSSNAVSPSVSGGGVSGSIETQGLSDWTEVHNKISGASSPMRNRGIPGRYQEPFEAAIESIDEFEYPSPKLAAMQACGLFVTIDDSSACPPNFMAIIKRRRLRARHRVFAMRALQTALQIKDIVADPYCVNELLLFVRAAMQVPSRKRDSSEHASASRAHYLVNLEGCPANILTDVQSAFLNLYGDLSRLIGQYITAWGDKAKELCQPVQESRLGPAGPFGSSNIDVLQPHIAVGSIKLMLSLWILGYSNRDHRFVMQSSLVQSLYKLLSLANSEMVAQCSYNASERLSEFVMEHDHRFPDVRKWSQWSSKSVNTRLRAGTLSCRSILHHLQMIPDSIIDKGQRFLNGIGEPLTDLRSQYGVTETSHLHATFGKLIEAKIASDAIREEEQEKQLQEQKRSREELLAKRMSSVGVFETSAPGILLSKHGQVATFPRRQRRFHNPIILPQSVYVAKIEFDKNAVTIPKEGSDEVAVAKCNYFEVTILEIGDGSISVGLSTERMINVLPGKEADSGPSPSASFGYLGSTGEKLGGNCTSGLFPKFVEGDIIGCGVNHSRNSIFYTRNGIFLGEAFTKIDEACFWTPPDDHPAVGDTPPPRAPLPLIPVVGFLNQCTEQQAVQVNFGISEFMYKPENAATDSDVDDLLTPCTVVAHPGALHERKIVEAEEQTGLPLLSRKNSIVSNDDIDEGITSQENEITEATYAEKSHQLLQQCEAGMAYESELFTLRNYACALMRYILIETCRTDSDYSSSLDAKDSELPPQFTTPALMRGISLYGTPKTITHEDGVFLQEGISAAIIQQLILGATYLSRCQPPGSAKKDCDESGSGEGNLKSVMPLACVPPTDRMHSMLATQDAQLDLQGENESVSSMGSINDGSATSGMSRREFEKNNVPVLEAVEVEPVLFTHLTTLAALMGSTKSLRKEMGKKKSIAALLLLLKCGSPRVRAVVSYISRCILPTMVPDEVEQALSNLQEDVRSRSSSNAGTGADAFSTGSSGSRRRQRRMPDGLVRALLVHVTDALRVYGWSSETSADLSPTTDPASQVTRTLPYGTGKQSLVFADQNITIIQSLFEAPLWTELIACHITDSLRNAIEVVKELGELPVESISAKAEETILAACAACSSLCGLGTTFPGVKVISSESKAIGIFLHSNSSTDEARVIFEDVKDKMKKSDAHENSMKNVEVVKCSSLRPCREGADVDLSRSSQPLLSHMMILMKLLLNRHLTRQEANSEAGAVTAILMRLNYFISIAMATLLDKQSDLVIDAAQDTNIVGEIVKMALLPTGMNFFPSLDLVSEMWRHSQGRALESAKKIATLKPPLLRRNSSSRSRSGSLVDGSSHHRSRSVSVVSLSSSTDGPPTSPSAENHAAAIADSDDQDDESSVDSHIDELQVLLSDEASVRARQERANVISVEMEINASVVLDHLEFHMMDENRTRVSLNSRLADGSITRSTHDSSTPTESTEVPSIPRSEEAANDTAISESIDQSHLAQGLVETPSNEELDQIVEHATADPSIDGVDDAAVYAMDLARIGSINGKSDDKEGCKKETRLIEPNTYLIESNEEGPVTLRQAIGRVCLVNEASASTIQSLGIVSFFDESIGVDVFETIDLNSMRIVKSFYDRSTSLPCHTYTLKLDQAACILSMRRIASKLMVESSLNVDMDLESPSHRGSTWLRLLKFSTVEDSDIGNKTEMAMFQNMCNSLLTRARGYTAISHMPFEAPSLASSNFESALPLPPPIHTSAFPILAIPPSPSANELKGSFPSPMLQREGTVPTTMATETPEAASTLTVGGTSGFSMSPLRINSSSGSSVELGIVNHIVDDMEATFSSLASEKSAGKLYDSASGTSSTPSSESGSADLKEASKEETQIFASPHPYPSPCRTARRVDLPVHWAGALLQFSPKCRTTTSLTTFKMYKKEADYLEDKTPDFTFTGCSKSPEALENDSNFDVANIFRSSATEFPENLNLIGWESFLYVFETELEGTDKPLCYNMPLRGNIVEGTENVEIRSDEKTPTALGEEDTLFNLFDTTAETEMDEVSIACADIAPLRSGSWYFEVAVDCPQLKGISESKPVVAKQSDRVRVGLCGFGVREKDTPNGMEYLGDSKWSVALAESGSLFADGTKLFDEDGVSLQPLRHGDIVSCHFSVDAVDKDGKREEDPFVIVAFACNGVWGKQFRLSLPPDSEGVHCNGVRPTFSINSIGTKLKVNYGTRHFQHADSIPFSGSLWKPVLARPLVDVNLHELAYGFEFTLKPLKQDILTHVVRDFTLVTKIKANPRLKDNEGDDDESDETFHIWRPNIPEKWKKRFFGFGDVITTSSCPPRGAVVVDKAPCKFPDKFKLVIKYAKDYSIFRPTCEDDKFVSMGDFIWKGSCAPSVQDLRDSGLCPILLPKLTVKEIPIGRKVLGGKSKHSYSIWSARNGLGTFFGSPVSSKYLVPEDGDKPDKDWETDVEGVGTGYALKQSLGSSISGEWVTADDVMTTPSLTWGKQVLNFLLDNPRTQEMVLRPKTFAILLSFIQSHSSPAPLVAVGPLIRMIRVAQENNVILPLERIEPLCKTILTKASSLAAKAGNNNQLSDAMLTLVDLVVGVQSAQVAKRTEAELRKWLSIRSKHLTGDMKEWLNVQREIAMGSRTGKANRFVVNFIDTVYIYTSSLTAHKTATPPRHLHPRITVSDVTPEKEAPKLPVFDPLSSFGGGLLPLGDRSASAPDLNQSPFRDVDDEGEGDDHISNQNSPEFFDKSNHSPRPSSVVNPLQKWSDLSADKISMASEEYKSMSNLDEQWWLSSNTSETRINDELLVQPSRISYPIDKENISKKLKMVLSFLAALGAGVDPTRRSLEMRLFKNAFKPSFPRLLISKIWYEFASLTIFEESEHPYTIPDDAGFTFQEASNKIQEEFGEASEKSGGHEISLPSSSDDDKKILVSINNSERHIYFKIKVRTVMQKLFDAFILRSGMDGELTFRMPASKGGAVIKPSDTPKQLGLEDDDVMTVQRGGAETESANIGILGEVPQTNDKVENKDAAPSPAEPIQIKTWRRHRRVYFPGSSKINFFLDRRSALGRKSKLIFRSSSNPSEIRTFTPFIDNIRTFEKSLSFTGPEVIVTFQVSGDADGSMPSNPDNKWGWAFMAVGSDDGYNRASVTESLVCNGVGDSSGSPSKFDVAAGDVALTHDEEDSFFADMIKRIKYTYQASLNKERESERKKIQTLSQTHDKNDEGPYKRERWSDTTDTQIDVESIMKALDKSISTGEAAGDSSANTQQVQAGKPFPIFKPSRPPATGGSDTTIAIPSDNLGLESDTDGSKLREMVEKTDPILTRLQACDGYRTGTLRVPYAQESELTISRTEVEGKEWKYNVSVIFELCAFSLNPQIETVKIPANSKASGSRIKVHGDYTINYHIFLIETKKEPEPEPEPEPEANPVQKPGDQLEKAEDQESEAQPCESDAPERDTSAGDAALSAAPNVDEPVVASGDVPLDVWACGTCTLYNANSVTICSVCGAPRGAVDVEDATEEGGAEASAAGWWCSVCTYINPISATTCGVCETQRADAPASDDGDNDDDDDGGGDDDDHDEDDEDESDTGVSEEEGGNDFDDSVVRGTTGRRIALPSDDPPALISKVEKVDKDISNIDSLSIVLHAKKLTVESKCRSRLRCALARIEDPKETEKQDEEDERDAKGKRKIPPASPTVTPHILRADMALWTPQADAILLDYINSVSASSSDKQPSFHTFSKNGDGCLPLKYLEYKNGEILSKFSMVSIQSRILLLGAFNKCIEELLPLVNVKNTDFQSWGAMIRKHNRYVFSQTKQDMLEKIVNATTARSGAGLPASIVLNNMTAMSSRDAGEVEPGNSQCCFVQAFRQLQTKPPTVYKHIFASDRVFQINYTGEMGIDAGGVFREGVSAMIQDLFGENFNLLILCPNGQHETYLNCEKYIPNPKHTGPLASSMFEFVGKLMATSLRAKLMLPFEFPSIIWKKICNEDIDIEDLRAVDAITCTLLETLRNCEEDGIVDQPSFAAKFSSQLKWTYNGSDGVERELYSGSCDRIVTYSDKEEYCNAVESKRLHEFDEQTDAIYKGFSEVLPESIIQLFCWEQVEMLVAGSPAIDIALWKSQTINGVSTRLANLFWKVMESLTEKEQSLFIRFAWGRSRLPPLKEFSTKMRLTPGEGRLPVAHTCFFSIELPEYDTEDEMRHGLLTAIHFGVGGVLVS